MKPSQSYSKQRRELLRYSLFSPLTAIATTAIPGCSNGGANPPSDILRPPDTRSFGPLLQPDSNGVRLPAGYTSRIVARTRREPKPGCGYAWHDSPDGGATFATADGGWVYVSNSEVSDGLGGAGALMFDKDPGVPGSRAKSSLVAASGNAIRSASAYRWNDLHWAQCDTKRPPSIPLPAPCI
jgi:hypothetical protein